MSYYIVTNNYNLPTSSASNGVLAEQYDANTPFPPMKYSWTKPRDPDRIYPSELFYILKGETTFNIDYSSFWDGYIISEKFKSLLDSANCPHYKSVKLAVINTKGEDIAKGERFFFIDMRSAVQDIIDYAHSSFILNEDMIKIRGLTVEAVRKSGDYFGNIKSYEQLSLKQENIRFDIFKLKDLAVNDLVCNEQCCAKIRESFNTIECINLMDMRPYNNRFA
ncbi:Imm43 family immunity protein [Niabella drilacis]|uniref:Immunity protein 43 n=1 Tax=Niabella drilacis (strain DSM 25811 / CCM 8410 / CCUG 62505 / LMG 26954 / E90) TaxID=1285928 RepID=A0A1G6KPH3_NIADE|nr:hypothetical protein [Niabella drilacis]SDC32843.1 Immunity protein 43 [Niabella drilacis]